MHTKHPPPQAITELHFEMLAKMSPESAEILPRRLSELGTCDNSLRQADTIYSGQKIVANHITANIHSVKKLNLDSEVAKSSRILACH